MANPKRPAKKAAKKTPAKKAAKRSAPAPSSITKEDVEIMIGKAVDAALDSTVQKIKKMIPSNTVIPASAENDLHEAHMRSLEDAPFFPHTHTVPKKK